MSTSGTMPPSEAVPPPRRRPPSLILPKDPSPEDLAQAWTLSDRDKTEALRCCGDAPSVIGLPCSCVPSGSMVGSFLRRVAGNLM